MAFPAVIPLLPESVTIKTRNLRGQMESGDVRVKNKWPYPLRDVTLQFRQPSKAEGRLLWQFYCDRLGGLEPFNYFLYYVNDYVREYVGTGNGTREIFDLPCKDGADIEIYINGTVQQITTDYTLDQDGADGADRITFVAAPALGERITCDFTGRLKIRGRFADDEMTFDTFWNRIVETGLKISGELNA